MTPPPAGVTGTAGTVAAFDEEEGLGTITATDGAQLPFHCVEIVDGTRTVAVGARVRFRTLAKLGRAEAVAVEHDDGAG